MDQNCGLAVLVSLSLFPPKPSLHRVCIFLMQSGEETPGNKFYKLTAITRKVGNGKTSKVHKTIKISWNIKIFRVGPGLQNGEEIRMSIN